MRHLSREVTFNDDSVKTPNLTKYNVSQLISYLHVQLKIKSPRILNLLHWPRIKAANLDFCRSQWSRGLRRRTAVTLPLRLCVRIPPEAWISVRCERCVLLGRRLCVRLITCPEESYRLWFAVECDLETSWIRRFWPTGELLRPKNKKKEKRKKRKLMMLENTPYGSYWDDISMNDI